MGKKNYYAVKEGKQTGIFRTWAECSSQVTGYKGAIFKGFETLSEAEEFIGIKKVLNSSSEITNDVMKVEISEVKEKKNKVNKIVKPVKEGYDVEPIKSIAKVKSSKTYINPSEIHKDFEYIAFIDGSYDKINKTYGSGVVVLKDNLNSTELFYEAGYDKWDQWNIVGELQSAKLALKKAEELGFKNVAIYHDLKNIALWATGEWKAKNEYTQEYVRFIEEYSKRLNIYFIKVKAHSTESKYNDLADEAAKQAIVSYNLNRI